MTDHLEEASRQNAIGKRVLLKPGHPYAGKTGTVVAVEQVDGPVALRVEFDGLYDGACSFWRKRYEGHLDAQRRIKERLGW